MENDTLVAIPLFLFMGYVVERANIVNRLFFSLCSWRRETCRGPWRSPPSSPAPFSPPRRGIVGAVVTLMGLLAFPAMAAADYNKEFASGVICAGGTLGILIPPSIMLIVYAAIAELSPLRLYAAAVFPGLLLAGFYILYVLIRAGLNPSIAPTPKMDDAPPVGEIYLSLLTSFVPLTILIMLVLGSILGGLATPAEAAAMGALGGLVLAFCVPVAQLEEGQGVRIPDREGHRHGVLDVRRVLDIRRRVLLSRRSRRHRALGRIDGSRAVAVPGHGAADHLHARLAPGVVGDPDHLRADLPADAGRSSTSIPTSSPCWWR